MKISHTLLAIAKDSNYVLSNLNTGFIAETQYNGFEEYIELFTREWCFVGYLADARTGRGMLDDYCLILYVYYE